MNTFKTVLLTAGLTTAGMYAMASGGDYGNGLPEPVRAVAQTITNGAGELFRRDTTITVYCSDQNMAMQTTLDTASIDRRNRLPHGFTMAVIETQSRYNACAGGFGSKKGLFGLERYRFESVDNQVATYEKTLARLDIDYTGLEGNALVHAIAKKFFKSANARERFVMTYNKVNGRGLYF